MTDYAFGPHQPGLRNAFGGEGHRASGIVFAGSVLIKLIIIFVCLAAATTAAIAASGFVKRRYRQNIYARAAFGASFLIVLVVLGTAANWFL